MAGSSWGALGTDAEQVLDAGGDSAEGRVAGGLEAGITDDGVASGHRAANGALESSSEAPVVWVRGGADRLTGGGCGTRGPAGCG